MWKTLLKLFFNKLFSILIHDVDSDNTRKSLNNWNKSTDTIMST